MSEKVLPEMALPHARVLSYVTTISTPTRVRVVAARGMVVWGMICLLVAGIAVVVAGSDIRDRAARLAVRLGPMPVRGGGVPVPRGISFSDVVAAAQSSVKYMPRPYLLIPLALGFGLFHVLLAGGVRRGRRLPCLASAFALGVPMLLAALAAAYFGGVAILVMDDLVRGPYVSAAPARWAMLILPLAVLAILLLNDLGTFLRWIAQNPVTEKPAVSFLSGKGEGMSEPPMLQGSSGAAPLPNMPILNYLTRNSSTRAQRTAFVILLALGTVVLLIGSYFLVDIGREIYQRAKDTAHMRALRAGFKFGAPLAVNLKVGDFVEGFTLTLRWRPVDFLSSS